MSSDPAPPASWSRPSKRWKTFVYGALGTAIILPFSARFGLGPGAWLVQPPGAPPGAYGTIAIASAIVSLVASVIIVTKLWRHAAVHRGALLASGLVAGGAGFIGLGWAGTPYVDLRVGGTAFCALVFLVVPPGPYRDDPHLGPDMHLWGWSLMPFGGAILLIAALVRVPGLDAWWAFIGPFLIAGPVLMFVEIWSATNSKEGDLTFIVSGLLLGGSFAPSRWLPPGGDILRVLLAMAVIPLGLLAVHADPYKGQGWRWGLIVAALGSIVTALHLSSLLG